MKKESTFQHDLIEELEDLFPGCLVTKMYPYIQGIPDLLILYKKKWAMLECKKSEEDRNDPQPNQEYYVDMLDAMSFASFIYPENKDEVLYELEQTFCPRRRSRVYEPKPIKLGK